jgi:hypothetical protein
MQIPIHSGLQRFLEIVGRTPPQLSLDFAGVNGIASVMSRTISDKLDESPARFLARPVQPDIKKMAEQVNDINVVSLGSSPYVVSFPWPSLLKNPDKSITVVYDIKPVPHMLPVSVDG